MMLISKMVASTRTPSTSSAVWAACSIAEPRIFSRWFDLRLITNLKARKQLPVSLTNSLFIARRAYPDFDDHTRRGRVKAEGVKGDEGAPLPPSFLSLACFRLFLAPA